jgi:hypothetical protein
MSSGVLRLAIVPEMLLEMIWVVVRSPSHYAR